jgi:hypothetical protein
LVLEVLRQPPAICADRIAELQKEVEEILRGFVCSVCGRGSDDGELGFSLTELGIIPDSVHKKCCPSAKAVLPIPTEGAESSPDEFLSMIRAEGTDDFGAILEFTTGSILAFAFEKLPVVPFLVGAGFTVLSRGKQTVAARIAQTDDPLRATVLLLWVLKDDEKQALFQEIRKKGEFEANAQKVAQVITVVRKLHEIVKLGEDGPIFTEELSKQGYEVFRAIKSAAQGITELAQAATEPDLE